MFEHLIAPLHKRLLRGQAATKGQGGQTRMVCLGVHAVQDNVLEKHKKIMNNVKVRKEGEREGAGDPLITGPRRSGILVIGRGGKPPIWSFAWCHSLCKILYVPCLAIPS